jgi:hypothetical protein
MLLTTTSNRAAKKDFSGINNHNSIATPLKTHRVHPHPEQTHTNAAKYVNVKVCLDKYLIWSKPDNGHIVDIQYNTETTIINTRGRISAFSFIDQPCPILQMGLTISLQ